VAKIRTHINQNESAPPPRWRPTAERAMSDNPGGGQSNKSWWYVLLLLQFALALWVSFYNKVEPTLAGIPFFYWYQLLLIVVGAILTAIVYFKTER
jgi:FtsH-binding integral membrane protein